DKLTSHANHVNCFLNEEKNVHRNDDRSLEIGDWKENYTIPDIAIMK
ncbi:10432_t:CDS:1, partial [Dentiscutata erythropus]